jgi:flavin-binding protein dodecin
MSSFAKTVEITAESSNNFHDAIQEGIQRANNTLRDVRKIWIKSEEVNIENGQVQSYRVKMKVTFSLEE